MAQTTAGIPVSGFKVEVSTNGSAWTNISGAAATVTIEGGDNKVGTQHTAEGAEAIVVSGNKIDPRTITVRSVYTEESGETFATVWAQYIATDKVIYLRWCPKGGGAGDFQYTCAVGGAAAAVPVQAYVYDNGANIYFSRDLTAATLDETQWTMNPGGVVPDSAEAGLSGIANMVTLVKIGFTVADLATGVSPFDTNVWYAGTDLLDGAGNAIATFNNFTAINGETLSVMVGDSGSGGTQGLPPAPAAGSWPRGRSSRSPPSPPAPPAAACPPSGCESRPGTGWCPPAPA